MNRPVEIRILYKSFKQAIYVATLFDHEYSSFASPKSPLKVPPESVMCLVAEAILSSVIPTFFCLVDSRMD